MPSTVHNRSIRPLPKAKVALAGALLAASAVTLPLSLASGAPAPAATTGGVIRVFVITPSPAAQPSDYDLIVGAFADHGRDHSKGNTVTLDLTKGTFKADVTALNKDPGKIVAYEKSCSYVGTVSAPVRLFGGTGAYAGISGTLMMTGTFAGVGPIVNGKCSQTKTAAASTVLTGSGRVSF